MKTCSLRALCAALLSGGLVLVNACSKVGSAENTGSDAGLHAADAAARHTDEPPSPALGTDRGRDDRTEDGEGPAQSGTGPQATGSAGSATSTTGSATSMPDRDLDGTGNGKGGADNSPETDTDVAASNGEPVSGQSEDGRDAGSGPASIDELYADAGIAATTSTELEATDSEGPTSEGQNPEDEESEAPAGYVKAIIGVGYGGLRIVSRDEGRSWGDRAYANPSGGDDEDLLRAVAYGKGRWIATGWKLMVSDDGVNWDDLGMLQDGIIDGNPIVEGLAYHDGYFYAAGDGEPSRIYRSSDGVEWSRHAEIGNTVKHTGLAYNGGLFVSYGDSETSYESADALAWTEMAGLSSATYCEGEYKNFSACHEAAWFDSQDGGFYLFPEWGGEIRRSTDGEDFESVYRDDQENTLYRARAVAEGYVVAE